MDIKISKSARTCCACNHSFEHEEPFTSILLPNDQELNRSDYCETCWTEQPTPEPYSSWKSKFYDPDVANQASEESFSPLRQLFYEAVEGKERTTLAMAFLAAAILLTL